MEESRARSVEARNAPKREAAEDVDATVTVAPLAAWSVEVEFQDQYAAEWAGEILFKEGESSNISFTKSTGHTVYLEVSAESADVAHKLVVEYFRDKDVVVEAADFSVSDVHEVGGRVAATIGQTSYEYEPDEDFLEKFGGDTVAAAKALASSVAGLARHSAGRAVQYLKKHAKHVAGGKKFSGSDDK